jgi:hypothetical protein
VDLEVGVGVISIDWATMVMSAAGVWKQTSPSIASIVILLAWLSKVILPLPTPSSMISCFLSSSNVIFEPRRDLSTQRGLPPGFLSGGLSLPFHSAPTTSGRLRSPCSNMTSTSPAGRSTVRCPCATTRRGSRPGQLNTTLPAGANRR